MDEVAGNGIDVAGAEPDPHRQPAAVQPLRASQNEANGGTGTVTERHALLREPVGAGAHGRASLEAHAPATAPPAGPPRGPHARGIDADDGVIGAAEHPGPLGPGDDGVQRQVDNRGTASGSPLKSTYAVPPSSVTQTSSPTGSSPDGEKRRRFTVPSGQGSVWNRPGERPAIMPDDPRPYWTRRAPRTAARC